MNEGEVFGDCGNEEDCQEADVPSCEGKNAGMECRAPPEESGARDRHVGQTSRRALTGRSPAGLQT
jgi:hypothetical protein